MREMKDSGIEYIGEIPTAWCIRKMKYVAEECSENGLMDPENSSYIGLENVVGYSNDIVATDTDYELSIQKRCHKDNVLFGKLRPYLSKVIIVPCDGFCTGEFLELTKYKGDIRFLRYSLLNMNLIDAINMSTYGAKMPRANSGFIMNCYITYPTYNEQKAIADFLDAKCEEVDMISTDIQAEIDTLEEYKRSLITEKVTKGLNPNVAMKDSGIEWVGQCPAHWKIMANKYVMKRIKHIKMVYENEDILSLTKKGVIVRGVEAGGKMPTSFDGYQILYPNNLLMCLFDYDVTPRCIGLIKNNGLSSPAYSQFIMKNQNCETYYYYYYLMIDNTKTLLHLAKNLRHSFTEEQLGLIYVPVPPREEQQKIACFLENKCAEIDFIIIEKKKQLAVLDNYKKVLIYEYVTGKKRIAND